MLLGTETTPPTHWIFFLPLTNISSEGKTDRKTRTEKPGWSIGHCGLAASPFPVQIHYWACLWTVLLLSCSSMLSHIQLFCYPMGCSPGSSVHRIPKKRILELVAISSSWGSCDPRMEPVASASPALAGGFFTAPPSGKPLSSLSTTAVMPQL